MSALSDLDAMSPARLSAANIHPVTRLATDYLNHFNEVVMLMGLVSDMPDMVADIRTWQPKSYAEHFAQSGFAAKDLAIAAYAAAPPEIRARFDTLVDDMNRVVLDGIARFEADPPETWGRTAEATVEALHPLIEATSGVINGGDDVSGLGADADTHAQAAIDALFAD